jgi:hypothetical protein
MNIRLSEVIGRGLIPRPKRGEVELHRLRQAKAAQFPSD